jgi:hypothetical protein
MDRDEDSVWLDLSASISSYMVWHDVIDTNIVGQSPQRLMGCYATVSNLGERAFISFSASNNIGVTGILESNTNDILAATGANIFPGNIRELAYTPYQDKVIAAICASQANSRVMVLNATALPIQGNTILPSAYTLISDASLNCPEGIGMQPLFDRDGDKISDLIEARNLQEFIAGSGTPPPTIHLNPVINNIIVSTANGTPTNGSITNCFLLPEEGIGYRHFYGSDRLNTDNWGTLNFIKVIEAVGREWNQLPPLGANIPRPRISIGDISLQNGGTWSDHASHQNGQDADVRYVKADGGEGPCNINPHPILDPPGTPDCNFDYDETKQLIDLFCESGAQIIFVDSSSNLQNDTYMQGCQVQFDDPAHRHHFHVRIVN